MTSEFCVAVHALVFLNHKGGTVSSEELAQNICTNPARVRKVMAKLKRAGLVETKEGADGGYLFEENPAKVSLETVSQALNIAFVSSAWRSGNTEMKCLIASGMADIMDTIYRDLDHLCKEHLDKISIRDLEDKIFKDRANSG